MKKKNRILPSFNEHKIPKCKHICILTLSSGIETSIL